MIQTLDIKYSSTELQNYLHTLDNEYARYHWHYVRDHNDPRSLGNHNSLLTMHGYGLQTIYEDITFPYHCDIDPHDEGPEYFRDTPLVFGIFKSIKEQFTNVHRSFIMTFKSGDYIGKWTTGSQAHSRIFIPIKTTGKAWLRYYHKDAYYSIIPEVGKVYKIKMEQNVSYANITNTSADDISFIMFNTI